MDDVAGVDEAEAGLLAGDETVDRAEDEDEPKIFGTGDDAEDEAGRANGGGIFNGALDDEAAGRDAGAGPNVAGAAVEDEEPAIGAPAIGRSLSDGADEVEAAAAAGACVSVAVLPVTSLALTRSTAELLAVSRLPAMVRPMQLTKNRVARTAVKRVSRLPAPRADMKPDGPPPMPSAPPSERWIRINPPMQTEMMT